ncbi:MAG: hypothetical protein DRQ48_05905, partial [Gammaproteobacteria bacterium]
AGGRTNQDEYRTYSVENVRNKFSRQSRGSLVSATLRNHIAARVSAGHDLRGSFDVQDARMSRVHGCTRATFWILFFSLYKEKYHADKRRNQF